MNQKQIQPLLPILLLCVTLVSALNSATTLALSTDRDQPAEIEADDIEFDFKKGTKTYLENVLIVQGTLRIKADKMLTIDDKNGDLETATAWGSLARFKQRPDGKDDDVEGWAKKIVVDQKKNLLTLVGSAAIKQGPQTARGQTIVYNMANDTLQVKGGAKVGSSSKANAAKSKPRLQDPFKDDNQGPLEPAKIKTVAAKTADGNTDKDDEEPPEEQTEEEVERIEPARAGRSRLILQPK